MRCRKARSFLSAYCSDEFSGRKKLALSEHLATCADCRREEADYHTLSEVGAEIAGLNVSADFNTKLLNRVAQERFSETRTKAHLPKNAPLVRWTVVAPTVVTACMVFAFVMVGLQPASNDFGPGMAGIGDNSYLTAQPLDNPNLGGTMRKDWSLASQMEQADRLDRLSRRVVDRMRAGSVSPMQGLTQVSAHASRTAPWNRTSYRVRPVVRVYQTAGTPRGGNSAY